MTSQPTCGVTCEHNTHDDVRLLVFTPDGGQDGHFIFDFNGRRIELTIVWNGSSTAGGPAQDALAELMSGNQEDIGDDAFFDRAYDALDTVVEAGRLLFAALPAPHSTISDSAPVQLHTLIYRRIHHFNLSYAVEGKVVVSPDVSKKSTFDFAPDVYPSSLDPDFTFLSSPILAQLPAFPSTAVNVVQVLAHSGSATRIRLPDGQDALCKVSADGLLDRCVRHELEKLVRIAESSEAVAVPRLLGVVKHPGTGLVIGLVREWISGQVPSETVVAETSLETRQKWMTQIRRAVSRLHGLGLIWGDGKLENIVVDEKGDAWLIDLGGGFTKGWVDEELSDTVEGDEQALCNIMGNLGLDVEGI